MAEQKSVWAWVGIGCLILVVIGLVVVVGGGYVLWRQTRQFAEEMRDPAERENRVRDVLQAESLPEGYHAVTGFSAPFGLLRVAILSDQPPGGSDRAAREGERGLIYVEAIYSGQDEQELRDYFEGRTSDPAVLRRNNINVEPEDTIDRGVLTLREASAMYLVQRGSFSSHGVAGRGIMSVILIDCPQDARMRLATWYGPEPRGPEQDDLATGPVELSWAGTPADKEAMARFLAPFDFCRQAREGT